ncbi:MULTISPECIES: sensor domain-containing protein [unclassified Mycobacterium]|uniref:sensor domain-containing protein n=1 Tax=unclassified Mycobacterium TaxID=2642494 RepID=UPI0029C87E93|nr:MULTISPECIES: sensor domain-containing protein [unclassified Mycobacterium]
MTAVAGLAVLLAGCSQVVDGTASPAAKALHVLPTDGELTAAVGNALNNFGFRPFVGGPEILPDGFRTDAQASPIACIGVTDTTTRLVYEATPMLEAARESYISLDQRVAVAGVDAGVIRMASANDAQRVFDDAVRQWQGCDGKSVDKRVRGATNADISDVAAAGSTLSATLHTSPGPDGPTSLSRRVLGVRADTIVEVSLAVTPEGEPGSRAEAVAQTMLDKVCTVRTSLIASCAAAVQ